MNEIWSRIRAWMQANAPDALAALNRPATDVEIERTEKQLGTRFPEDVRASFRIHNGQSNDGPGLRDGRELLSLERIHDEWKVWKDLLDGGEFAGIQSEPQDPAIRPDWWNAKWLPLTYDGSGNHDCLDMDPAPGGTEGQIITMWHDDGERALVAVSYRAWLEAFADGLEAGEYTYSDEYGGIVRADML